MFDISSEIWLNLQMPMNGYGGQPVYVMMPPGGGMPQQMMSNYNNQVQMIPEVNMCREEPCFSRLWSFC